MWRRSPGLLLEFRQDAVVRTGILRAPGLVMPNVLRPEGLSIMRASVPHGGTSLMRLAQGLRGLPFSCPHPNKIKLSLGAKANVHASGGLRCGTTHRLNCPYNDPRLWNSNGHQRLFFPVCRNPDSFEWRYRNWLRLKRKQTMWPLTNSPPDTKSPAGHDWVSGTFYFSGRVGITSGHLVFSTRDTHPWAHQATPPDNWTSA